MKKINLILFMAIALLFVSCEKEANNAVDPEESLASIVGTWALTGYDVADGTVTASSEGQSASSEFTIMGTDFDAEVVFSENPQTFTSEGSFTTIVSTTFEGETTTQEEVIDDFLGAGAWRIENNLLLVSIDDAEEVVYRIISLTEQNMVIELDLEFNEEVNLLGTIATIATSGTYRLSLDKQ